MVSSEQSVGALREPILEGLRKRYPNQRTAEKLIGDVCRLFRYLLAKGVESWSDLSPQLVVGWYEAAFVGSDGSLRRPAQNTVRNRQRAARAMLEMAAALGAPVDVGSLVGERVSCRAEKASTRPLTGDELDLVQTHADAGLAASRRSVQVALALAGGSAAEVAGVRVGDVDLTTGKVIFRGGMPRTNPLCGWATETIARFIRNSQPLAESDLLAVTGKPDQERATATVTARLWEVLKDAGIAGRPGVTARSIRLAAAQKILEHSGIEAAAHFLGSPSLDNTATALGYEWQEPHSVSDTTN